MIERSLAVLAIVGCGGGAAPTDAAPIDAAPIDASPDAYVGGIRGHGYVWIGELDWPGGTGSMLMATFSPMEVLPSLDLDRCAFWRFPSVTMSAGTIDVTAPRWSWAVAPTVSPGVTHYYAVDYPPPKSGTMVHLAAPGAETPGFALDGTIPVPVTTVTTPGLSRSGFNVSWTRAAADAYLLIVGTSSSGAFEGTLFCHVLDDGSYDVTATDMRNLTPFATQAYLQVVHVSEQDVVVEGWDVRGWFVNARDTDLMPIGP